MSIRATITKIVIKQKRKKQINKNPKGKRFFVPRKKKRPVEVYLYEPKQNMGKKYPVMFNVHGGAWVGCDASMLDTQSMEMAEHLGAYVLNINYTKIDIQPFPYPQEEIRDVVLYFATHAEEYGVDRERFNLIGYSAGGHLCAGAAILLRDIGFSLRSQVLCYPFLDFTKGFKDVKLENNSKSLKVINEIFFLNGVDKSNLINSPSHTEPEKLKGLAPAIIIASQKDSLYEHATDYKIHLETAGVKVIWKEYENAVHGFLEVNHPEYKYDVAKTQEQAEIAKECECFIKEQLEEIWNS